MTLLISFRTHRFDVTKERPNESNAFAGEGLLKWLRAEIRDHQYASTEPDTEDWGWYINVTGPSGSYLVGATAEVEYKPGEEAALSYDVAEDAILDWTIQVHKHRTFKERLFGKSKMAADDALDALIERIVRSDDTLKDVEVSRDDI
jgi:hypothetical protein